MRKIALIMLATSAVTAHAIVVPTGPFAAPPAFQERFDTTTAGMYNALPVFGTPALAQRIGIGQMQVGPYPWVNTVPHLLVGQRADVRITTLVPMRRFGGFFNSGYFGVFSTSATFRFFDASNNFIGQQTVPMSTTMQFYAFQTFPKWRRVEIYGNVPGFAGCIGMDSLRIRPN
jgi:hypothetical protein